MLNYKALKGVLLVAVVIGSASVSLADKSDFRKVKWGMTRLEVMASEENAPESFGEPYIYYKPDVLGRRLHLIYEFIRDQLVDAVYIIVTQDNRDYLRYKEHIEKKYGKPKLALDEGVYKYRFVWVNETTEIVLRPGRSRECRIEYLGIEHKYLRNQIKQMRKEKIVAELFSSF